MVMTTELEGEIDKMCNFSEAIMERSLKRGIEQGLQQERFNAIERMIKANATREQILSYGYTEEEFAKVENGLCEYV